MELKRITPHGTVTAIQLPGEGVDPNGYPYWNIFGPEGMLEDKISCRPSDLDSVIEEMIATWFFE